MSNIIKEYYERVNINPVILNQKLNKLQQHTDIKKEFEDWIQNDKYNDNDCVSVNGYTAQKLSDLSEFIDGEGAFMLLIELRETPEKAMKRISEGFKIK